MSTDLSLVMLIGSPRSGTTWLQSLLGAHPLVATPQETDLFTRFIAPLDEAWRWQMRGSEADWIERRMKGLPSLLTTAEFRTASRSLIDAALQSVAQHKPGCEIVLEKSPSHSLHVATIAAYVPSVRFIHLIRDGRDAVDSMLAASQGWGAFWAPRSVAAGARLWAEYVRAARIANQTTQGCFELRYEALRAVGAPALVATFASVGISTDAAQCQAFIDDRHIGTHQTTGRRTDSILIGGEFAHLADRPEPGGFVRTGTGGGWRTWTPAQRFAFDAAAGDLLCELGYEPDRSWVHASSLQNSIRRSRRAAARLFRGGGARIARAIDAKEV